MKNLTLLSTFVLATLLLAISCKEQRMPQPIDTIIKWDMEDGTKPDRKAAIEKMHRIEEGESWRDIEYKNAKQTAQLRQEIYTSTQRSLSGIETIVEGHLKGTWIERGSTNQAGSVLATEYDADTDNIYTISAGGTLWQGGRDGNSWAAINQDFNFFGRMLLLLDNGPQKRILAAIEGRVHYSDDNGASWTVSEGIGNVQDGWTIKDAVKIKKADGSYDVMYLAKGNRIANVKLMHSSDMGESFDRIKVFSSTDMDNFAMDSPKGSENLYLMEQLSGSATAIWTWNHDTADIVNLTNESPISFGTRRGNLQAVTRDNATELYAFDNDLVVNKSIDEGLSWVGLDTLPITPWQVGLYVSPSNPDIMYTGGVNAYRSADGGQSWQLINEWWEYYDRVEDKLHADMMVFNEFTTAQGEPFFLVSNHGGLNVSYDEGANYGNIGMDGLNVAQYYSVATSPADINVIYAGSQDQGFQRGLFDDPDGALDFEQVISGDYGHIVFTENYQRLWTVYPGGWVTYYQDPVNGGYSDTYEVMSDNEPVWMPPMMPHPDPLQNIAYIAGGNADGGPGMYIIEMKHTSSGIVGTNLPHNFIGSQGDISAMEISPFNTDNWHVATSNGRYYQSLDGGLNFFEVSRDIPGGNYLYGSDIMASKLDDKTIYISGSGYSTAPVIVSRDGGITFTDMSNGMPATMAFGIATNEDESLIFAATEAGPYVYVVALDQWFNMLGAAAPYTRYWSVEYIPELNTARFGTYGRGVWDFEVDNSIVSSTDDLASFEVNVFPNPTVDNITIESDLQDSYQVSLFDSQGRQRITKAANNSSVQLTLTDLESGAYYLVLESKESRVVRSVIKK